MVYFTHHPAVLEVNPFIRAQQCIFKTSCSHYVYEQAREIGALAGLKALIYRYRSCRGGYMCYLNPITERPEMVLVSGEVIHEEDIANRFIKELMDKNYGF